MDSLALGLIFIIIFMVLNYVGILLQKFDTNRSGLPEDAETSLFLKRPLWVLGILMQTILVLPFFFLSIDLLGLTLAQPLATSGLLIFVIGAVIILKEKLYRLEWFGVALVFSSIFLISMSGITGDVSIDLFFQSSFFVTFSIFFLACVIIAVVGTILAKKKDNKKIFGYAILTGLAYSLVSIFGQFMSPALDMLFAGTIDIFGWFFLIIGIVFCVLGTGLGIIFSQKAFQRGQAIEIIPISNTVVNLLPILAGVFVFKQIITFWWLFIPGIGILLIGVSLLARFQK